MVFWQKMYVKRRFVLSDRNGVSLNLAIKSINEIYCFVSFEVNNNYFWVNTLGYKQTNCATK